MAFIAKAEGFLDKLIPAEKTKCSLFECNAGKLFLVFALLSIATSAAVSWGTFFSTILFEVIIGFVVAWLCRSCRKPWAWAIVFITTLLPMILSIVMIIGVLVIAKKSS